MSLRDLPDHTAELRHLLVDPWKLCRDLGLIDGYKPMRQARGLSIRCPVHADRTPSCSVTLAPDGYIRVKCHGCDFSGDAFSLVAAARNLDIQRDFRAVLEIAAGIAGITLSSATPYTPPPTRHFTRPVAIKPTSTVSTESFQKVATWLMGQCPLQGSVAVGLLSRGILREAQADGWGELPANVVSANDRAVEGEEAEFESSDLALDRLTEQLRQRFQPLELTWLLNGSKMRWPEHRLIVPWRDPSGAIVEIQRRYAPVAGDEHCPARTPKYVFPSTAEYQPDEHFPYGIDHPDCAHAEAIWIVEGAVDVLALRALNAARPKPASMVALGVAGVERWEAVGDKVRGLAKGRKIRVALDADRAGESKVATIVEAMFRAGALEVTRPRPPGGAKDWGEVAAKTLWYEETTEMRHRRLQQRPNGKETIDRK